jgi:hypothetical protein
MGLMALQYIVASNKLHPPFFFKKIKISDNPQNNIITVFGRPFSFSAPGSSSIQ